MAFKEGINFRATSGYVTDGTDETHCIHTDGFPTVRAGATFGWESGGTPDSRDRNSGLDARLAGINFFTNVGTNQATWRMDLDTATDHDIRLALGDAASTQDDQYCEVIDGSTTFITIDETGNTTPQEDYIDATDVIRTSASDWVTNNAKVTRTFGSTILRVTIGNPVNQTNASTIAHIFAEEVGGAPAAESELSLMMMGVGT